jgi:membrane-associated phospholipid phosphatase
VSGALAVASRDTSAHSWVRAWPLRKPALAVLGIGGSALFIVTTAVGLLYVTYLDDGPVGDADRAGVEWFADRRTATLNSLTEIGSMVSDALVKVILVAVVGGAMVLIWRRWHDGVFLAVALIVEATVFVTSSFIVDRDRPPGTPLDEPAPSGSFPSGHTAAAVAFYGGLFIVVRWHTRNPWVRWTFGVVAVAAPLIVGVSRVQRGMHHPVDVAAGIVLGLATLFVVRAALARGVAELDAASGDDAPPQVRRLDLTEGVGS